jgi:UDP-N-acetylglucosamine 2-epimerase (non-hydrolysing)
MIEPQWRVDCVVGARPNFVKIAPIMRALAGDGRFAARLLHTGQHYDLAMNAVFFQELEIPAPDVSLDIGSQAPTQQTAAIMVGLENALRGRRPDLLLVVGDVNSTLAAALVAAQARIPLVHVEAGLRSGDRSMPEEINRLVTDRLSDLLLVTERKARDNLLAEGAAPESIVFVGNVMIDSLHFALERAVAAERTLAELGWGADSPAAREGFGLVTLHRPANVDDPETLARLVAALTRISREIALIFPAHPRTLASLARAGLDTPAPDERLLIVPPLSYLQTVGLMRAARLVITDSGGVQEETTALGVPCLTFRDNTERPITIDEGSNILVGTDPAALEMATAETLANGGKRGRVPELWDGASAPRIVRALADFLGGVDRRDMRPI